MSNIKHFLISFTFGIQKFFSNSDECAVFERLGDEYDISIAEEVYSEYITDGRVSLPLSDLWKGLCI